MQIDVVPLPVYVIIDLDLKINLNGKNMLVLKCFVATVPI